MDFREIFEKELGYKLQKQQRNYCSRCGRKEKLYQQDKCRCCLVEDFNRLRPTQNSTIREIKI